MKIALLSSASSIHTVRWANGLSTEGHEVHVITQQPVVDQFDQGILFHEFPNRGVLGYFVMAPAVRKLLQKIQPNLVNAHYASGYGTTARLMGYRPWVLSVWGSDVYDFPYKSPLHKWLIKKNLRAADQVASTSHCMADQTRSLVPEIDYIATTPFGVDVNYFKYCRPLNPFNEDEKPFFIGTVKTLSSKYGTDTLIKAFAQVRQDLIREEEPIAYRLRLRLVGGGPQTDEYKRMAQVLGIDEVTSFVGPVPYSEVPKELAKLDIFVALSRQESFGVAVIEAGAAGRPVVVADVGGLPEVTLDGETGVVVPGENPYVAADALKKLIMNPTLRKKMGAAGQRHVIQNYNWPTCVQRMIHVYEETITKYKERMTC